MDLRYICGMNFAPFAKEGSFSGEKARKSLALMKERTSSDFVVFVPNGLQDTPQSEEICYTSKATMRDDELKKMIEYAQSLELRVALKPTVNCKNGAWRAYVSFFNEDVHCEPKWQNWFDSYSEFQRHYASISQEMGCAMHIAGCEMVMSEYREKEWRQVIADIRSEYRGLVSYNTDKYQEHNVKWWDCVDIISSSGYYPLLEIEQELDRIEKVVTQYNKPFFFAEVGCMSVEGAKDVPNNWTLRGELDFMAQALWYDAMMTACEKREWFGGWAFWSWSDRLYSLNHAMQKGDYEIYGKPAEEVLCRHYREIQERIRGSRR